MDFSLSEDQALLQETARALLAAECPMTLVRAHIEEPSAAETLWPSLAGWTVLGGQDLVDLCLFLEEMGAVLAPGPYFATTALFAPLLAALDHELLPGVLDGEVTGTVAMADARARWIPHDGRVKSFVPEGERVDYVAAVEPGPTVVLYERPPARHIETIDYSRRLALVDLERASPAGPAIALDPATLDAWLGRAVVALSAELLGTVRWLLQTTVDYAKAREQFDRPIGSFQAVKHKLANMALIHEQAWSAVYYAAMTIDADDPDRRQAAHGAKIMAGEAAKLNAKDGIQVHGGIGFTFEHDLHLYMRRAYGDENLLGTSDWHRDRLADLVLGPVPAPA